MEGKDEDSRLSPEILGSIMDSDEFVFNPDANRVADYSRLRYALVQTALSRAAYDLSNTGQKLLLMSLAVDAVERKIRSDRVLDSTLRGAEFSITDFESALGLVRSGSGREQIRRACAEARTLSVTFPIRTEDGQDELTVSIFQATRVSQTSISLYFSTPFQQILDRADAPYFPIVLRDVGKLTSSYSLRLFLYFSSFLGLAGKNGNPPQVCWARISLQQLRKMLGLEDKYQGANGYANLRRKVIQSSIDEINEKISSFRIREVIFTKEPHSRSFSGVKFYLELTTQWDFDDISLPLEILKTGLSDENREFILANRERFLESCRDLNRVAKLDPSLLKTGDETVRKKFRDLFVQALLGLFDQEELVSRISTVLPEGPGSV